MAKEIERVIMLMNIVCLYDNLSIIDPNRSEPRISPEPSPSMHSKALDVLSCCVQGFFSMDWTMILIKNAL